MDIVAIIISIIALVGAGFAFIRASSSHHILGKRIEDLKERIKSSSYNFVVGILRTAEFVHHHMASFKWQWIRVDI